MLISLLAIVGLIFFLKEADGPFGILNFIRNVLLSNKYVGVFFYKLLSCYFCTGCYVGVIIYLLSSNQTFYFNELIIWFFAGGATGLLFNKLLLD